MKFFGMKKQDNPMEKLLAYRSTLVKWRSSLRVLLASLITLQAQLVVPTDDPDPTWKSVFSQMVYSWLDLDDYDPDLFPRPESRLEMHRELTLIAENLRQEFTGSPKSKQAVDCNCILVNLLLIALGLSTLPDALQEMEQPSPTTATAPGLPRSPSPILTSQSKAQPTTSSPKVILEITSDASEPESSSSPSLSPTKNGSPPISPTRQPFRKFWKRAFVPPKFKRAPKVTFDPTSYVLQYDARARAVFILVGRALEAPDQDILDIERLVAQSLYVSMEEAKSLDQKEQVKAAGSLNSGLAPALANQNTQNRVWKYVATGTAAALGATAIGLTAGLAAPLVVAGLSALSITGLAFFSTVGGAALIGSLFGLAGGGLTGYRMNRRVRGLHEFQFDELFSSNDRLPMPSLVSAILIPGFLNHRADARHVWIPYFHTKISQYDHYVLSFDSDALLGVGNAFSRLVSSEAVTYAAGQVLKQTVLATLMSALVWPMAIVKAGSLIDNPWGVGLNRAENAGKVLAEVLASRTQGNRPVILVGYSLGALVIYHCLLALAERKAYGLVDSVVFLGGPFSGKDPEVWAKIRSVVSRRIVNGYSKSDWILAFLYRVNALSTHMAGLTGVASAINEDGRIENVDLSKTIQFHSDYTKKLETILTHIHI
ncbi:hypothetical protein H4R35_004140 [Dimargaris xerosporica]|nr:hypothetical protein H4R35_004140 [Dimargaris xerosporica]